VNVRSLFFLHPGGLLLRGSAAGVVMMIGD
jgi:hypothetical protein